MLGFFDSDKRRIHSLEQRTTQLERTVSQLMEDLTKLQAAPSSEVILSRLARYQEPKSERRH